MSANAETCMLSRYFQLPFMDVVAIHMQVHRPGMELSYPIQESAAANFSLFDFMGGEEEIIFHCRFQSI
jgi:hypothetical protein